MLRRLRRPRAWRAWRWVSARSIWFAILINGFFIIVEDQFVVGESVRIGTVVGRVEHMTLRRTVIRDIQGAVVSIPNGEIAQVCQPQPRLGPGVRGHFHPAGDIVRCGAGGAGTRRAPSFAPMHRGRRCWWTGRARWEWNHSGRPELRCGWSFAPFRAAG